MSAQDDGITGAVASASDEVVANSVEEEGIEGAEAVDTSLSIDVVLDIIRNRRRRLVLRYLEDVEDETTLVDLAEHIAAIENDTTVEALSAQQRKRVYVGLYQCHLPKMAEVGIVDFDKDQGGVKPGPNIGDVEPYLNAGSDDRSSVDDRWYPVLAAVAVVGYVLAAFAGSIGMLVGGVIVFASVGAFGTVTALRRRNGTGTTDAVASQN